MSEQLWLQLSEHADDNKLLADTLRQLIDLKLEAFPPCARRVIFDLLSERHEPYIWLHTCALLCQLYNVSPSERHELARYGVLSYLAKVLKESVSAMALVTTSSEDQYRTLVQVILSMMLRFAHASDLCVLKILQHNVLDAVLLPLSTTSGMYAPGIAETNKQLIETPLAVLDCITSHSVFNTLSQYGSYTNALYILFH